MDNGKDTVYVDIDDEITAIIDKVTGSKQKIVALILPKRAAVLQSAVNMKLLKRSADNAGKKAVLITTESALMPLAGAAGIHVAKTPTTKPEVPVAPVIHDNNQPIDEDEPLELDDEPDQEVTAETAGKKPVGELAGDKRKFGKTPAAIETVELDDAVPAKAAAATGAASKATKKQPKVPNFSKFQKKIAIAVVLLIILIVGLIFANIVLPKATIAIATDATDYNSSLDITLDSTASKVSLSDNTVPATISQQQKTYAQQVAASGQKNNGDKATGSVKFTAQTCAPHLFPAPSDIPAGTGVSSGGNTYITQDSASFSPNGGSGSCNNWKSNSVDIVAKTGGSDYNVNDANFSVSGHSGVSGNGSASGGTDDIQKIVSQSDIDSAKNQIANQDTGSIKSALMQQIRGNNLYPMQATFSTGTPNVTSSSNAGDVADNVTVTEAVTYTMYGVKRSYLDTLIKNDIKQQIDPTKQSILDDGLDKAAIKTTGNTDTTNTVNVATTATVGPNLDLNGFKEQVKGKKSGYVKSLIGNQPGVTGVEVKLSPFWVGSVPKKTSKITITVGKSSDSNDSK